MKHIKEKKVIKKTKTQPKVVVVNQHNGRFRQKEASKKKST
jgi:hypothetical protein